MEGGRVEQRLELIARSFQGPLPPPETLKEYEEIYPGAAKWILDRAEKQGNHRQKIERMIVNRGTFGELLGVLSALTISVLTIGGGLWLIYNGRDLSGLGSIISALVALVTVYRTGKKKQG